MLDLTQRKRIYFSIIIHEDVMPLLRLIQMLEEYDEPESYLMAKEVVLAIKEFNETFDTTLVTSINELEISELKKMLFDDDDDKIGYFLEKTNEYANNIFQAIMY